MKAAATTWILRWLAAFVALRAVVVLLGFDGVFFWEETYRLLVAEALLDGWPLPVHDLQADPYNAGSLVFAALAAPVAAVAGPSLLALKGVAIAWSAAGFAAWLLVAERLGGRVAANALGTCWIAAPPVFVVFQVLALGSHSDTVTTSGLQALLLLRAVDATAPGRRTAWTAAWMAVAGASVWFGVFSALPLALSVAWALGAGVLPPGSWPLAAACFAAGLAPWIAYNVLEGGSLDVLARVFAGGGAAATRGWAATLWDLTVRGVPAALYFRDIGIPADVKVPRALLAYPWLAVYAASFAAVAAAGARRAVAAARHAGSARDAANGLASVATAGAATGTATDASTTARVRAALAAVPELPTLALLPVLLMVIAASTLEFNDLGTVRFVTFRILAPALPSMALAIALAAAKTGPALRAAALGACVALGAVGTGQLVADGAAGRELREAEARDTGAEAMGHLLVFKHGTDLAVIRERVAAMPASLRERAWRGVGFSFAHLHGTRRAHDDASALGDALLAVDADARPAALDGARAALTTGLAQVAPLPPGPRHDELAREIERAASAG